MSNLSPTDLMLQARDTATQYFNQAVRIIDEKFGEGYAKEHPQLVADFMKTAAMDFDTCMKQHVLIELSTDLSHLVEGIDIRIYPGDIRDLGSELKEASNSIAGSIDSIASSLNNLSDSVDRFLPPVEEFITFMPRGRK